MLTVFGYCPAGNGITFLFQYIRQFIIGQGELLTGYLLTYDALKMEFRKVKLPSDTHNCAVCGDHPTITELIDYEQAECDGVHL